MGLDEKVREAAEKYGVFRGLRKKIIVAFSGGADSSVLLGWLCANAGEFGLDVEAFHVDHMIRGEEAERDAGFCLARCRELGVYFESVRRDVPALAREWGCGLEEAGRRARYEAFAEVRARRGADAVATAHHADDNLETVIFNLARGTGTRGLCGIPPVREGVVRPLILCTRAEIAEYAAEKGIPFIEDATNESDEYRRNYIRHNLAPALRELNPRAAEAVSRMSELLRADDEWLTAEAKKLLEAAASGPAEPVRRYSCAAVAVHHRAVADRAIAEAARIAGAEGKINLAAAAGAVRDRRDTLVSVGGGLAIEIYRGSFAFVADTRGAEEPEFDITLEPGVPVRIPGTDRHAVLVSDLKEVGKLINIHSEFTFTSFKRDKIAGEIRVRSRRPGDKMSVRGVNRTVKSLLQEAGIPRSGRRGLPVFCDAEKLLFIPGVPGRRPDGDLFICMWRD